MLSAIVTGAWNASLNKITRIAGILVVDDHWIVREGLTALLAAQDGMRVLGSAATGHEAVLAAERLKPDIVIMDLVLPDMNGIDATHRIIRILPLTRFIILSASYNIEDVYRALRCGASGYVVKGAKGDELMQAVRAVSNGKQFLSPQVTPPAFGGAACYSLPKSPLERLSSRERDVMHRVVAGASSAVIARHLSLSRKTVDTYRCRLMAKLGVCNRSALIRLAIENEFTAERRHRRGVDFWPR
jgi:two-component system response regulator NreC